MQNMNQRDALITKKYILPIEKSIFKIKFSPQKLRKKYFLKIGK